MSGGRHAQRLDDFLTLWRAAHVAAPQDARLARFLEAFRPLRLKPAVKAVRKPVDPLALLEFLNRVRTPLEARRAQGGLLNPWTIAGVRRKEVVNSAILATFWSPQACGDLARQFLSAFCRRIDDPEGKLPTGEELAQPYAIRTEHCPVGQASERVDITIEGTTFVLGIEIKIDAMEGVEQLPRYVASINQWSEQRGKRPCVVFLAPFKTVEPGVLQAGWSDVAAAAKKVLVAQGSAPSSHRFLLESFIRHSRKFGG